MRNANRKGTAPTERGWTHEGSGAEARLHGGPVDAGMAGQPSLLSSPAKLQWALEGADPSVPQGQEERKMTTQASVAAKDAGEGTLQAGNALRSLRPVYIQPSG